MKTEIKISSELLAKVVNKTGIKNKDEAATFVFLWFIEKNKTESQKIAEKYKKLKLSKSTLKLLEIAKDLEPLNDDRLADDIIADRKQKESK
jgi:hypothetical protein